MPSSEAPKRFSRADTLRYIDRTSHTTLERYTIFGARVVAYFEEPPSSYLSQEAHEEYGEKQLRTERFDLQSYAQDPSLAPYVERFFHRGIKSEKAKKVLLAELGEEGYEDLHVPDLFPKGKISNNAFKSMLESHRDYMRDQQETFAQELPALKKKFLKRLEDAQFYRRFAIDKKTTKRRLDEFAFMLGDELSYDAVVHGPGWVDHAKRLVFLTDGTQQISFDHMFTHEAVHVLGGEAALIGGLSEGFHDYIPLKSGLAFEGRKNVGKLFWLEEGIVEELTAQLLKTTPKAHLEEVRLAQLLRQNGKKEIPFEVFVNAFFEDIDPGKHAPHTKKMFRELSESYSPTFTRRFDKRLMGVESPMNESERTAQIDRATRLLERIGRGAGNWTPYLSVPNRAFYR